MMNIRKLTGIAIITLVGSVSKVYALSAHIFRGTKDSDNESYYTQVDGSRSVLDMISLVNNYLWFAVGFFCFLFMIINGYKLITANGNEGKTKEATKALLGSVIGIAICLLAYIIVNLAVNLFAK